jgi:nucleoside-diphosphate-sugar epimerase
MPVLVMNTSTSKNPRTQPAPTPAGSGSVVVSGATGFIGRHLVPLLHQRGYRVVALGRDARHAAALGWPSDIEFHEVDLVTEECSYQPQAGASLVHLAWQGLPDYRSLDHLELNFPASCRFVRGMVERGVANVMVAGTCLEYGMQDGALSPETPVRPANPYAIAKNALRQYLECMQQVLPFSLKWGRLFYMYGAGQNPRSVLSQLDAAIANGDGVFRMSGGEQLRDYLPVEAVASGLLNLLQAPGNRLANICSGTPISIRRLVEQAIQARKSRIQIELGHYPYPDYEPMAFWGTKQDLS